MSTGLAPGSRHPIPVRRPDFPFSSEIPRHFAGGNALMTHAFNGAQLTFPDGERFFIRSVRDALPRVDDATLREQARGFSGQEAVHGREHERYFETLRAQGYEIDVYLRRFHRFIGWMDRLPARFRVSLTAAFEHFTATFGWHALSEPLIADVHPTMRSLIYWHACEEVEHKSVAFDVMQAAGVGYVQRILAFVVATAIFFGWVGYGARMLLRQDGFTRKDVKEMHAALGNRADPALAREVGGRLLAYFRYDFHPNDEDDLALAHRRLGEVGLAA